MTGREHGTQFSHATLTLTLTLTHCVYEVTALFRDSGRFRANHTKCRRFYLEKVA